MIQSAGAMPVLRAAGVHALCVPLALLLELTLSLPLPWQGVEGGLAAAISVTAGLAPWWIAINAVFVPALAVMLAADIAPAAAAAAFIAMTLVYWSVARTRVPLFLSSGAAIGELRNILDGVTNPRFLDVGCGTARVVARLARSARNGRFEGIECAPLPWLYARLRTLTAGPNCAVHLGDFWKRDLSRYDVVYAYLSPVPMAQLWQKARREMKPGSLLISNSFAVPGAEAGDVIALDDLWGSSLHVYRM